MKNTINTDLNDLNFDLDYSNYNPDEIDTDETINAVFVIDTSYSVIDYVNELNFAFNDFTESMQKSHIAEKLFVSIIEFNDKVTVSNGFRPISSIPPMDFSNRLGGWTALYDAVDLGLRNALDYRENLENSGIETKTLLFVITDGEDNKSKIAPHTIKKKMKVMKKDERSAFSFTSILFGVGYKANFEKAKNDMGIEHIAEIGTSGDELKKMIGFISQSISNVSSGIPTSTPVF